MNSAKRSVVLWALVTLAALAPGRAARADDDPFRELSAEWWQWTLSIPTPENPLADPTGAKCMVGQRGPVWFLAGGGVPGETTRTCTVPAGKVLFFPVLNAMFFDSPNVCGQGPEPIPVPEMRAVIDAFIAGATDISAHFDGQPLVNLRRVRSRVFEVALPEDNLFDVPCADLGGSPGGIFTPAVGDGYYAALRPLRPGNHTLHFHSEVPEFGFALDVTYNLIAVPTD